MAQAKKKNSKPAGENPVIKSVQLDYIDLINENLKKAKGIIDLAHQASAGKDNEIEGAMWAASDALEAVDVAFTGLQAAMREGV